MPANNPRLKWHDNLARDPQTKRWHVRKKLAGQTIQKGGFVTKSSALNYLDLLVLQDATGIDLSPAPAIEAACSDYFAYLDLKGASPETVTYYGSKFDALLSGLGNRRLDHIKQPHIDNYIRLRQAAGISNGTINDDQRTLLTLYRHLDITPKWKKRPLTHSPKKKTVNSNIIIRALWDHLDHHTRIAVGLVLLTGMRRATALKATADWIHDDELHIPESAMKKGEANRTYLVPTLREILPNEGPLITLTVDQHRTRLARASKQINLSPPYRGIGAFRAHTATYAVEIGYSPEHARYLLAHGTGTVTDRYLRAQAITQKKEMLLAIEAYIFPELASRELPQ